MRLSSQPKFAVASILILLGGCADHDRQSLRDCAEATALEARLMKEYSEILLSKDPGIYPIHATAHSKALTAVFKWKKVFARKQRTRPKKDKSWSLVGENSSDRYRRHH